jgi:hypothetical protein
MEKPSTNNLEKYKKLADVVSVEFDPQPYGATQKFIQAENEAGLTYVISYPHLRRHNAILEKYKKESGLVDLKCSGGGFLFKYKGQVKLSGKSLDYGPFDREFIKRSLSDTFPDLEVFHEREKDLD